MDRGALGLLVLIDHLDRASPLNAGSLGSLPMIDLKDWIPEENLRPWLEILSTVVGYDFDSRDWDAVDAGIVNTDSESFRWYEFPLGGDGAPMVKLAKEPGSGVVAVMASLATDHVEPMKLAIQIAQSYRLLSRS